MESNKLNLSLYNPLKFQKAIDDLVGQVHKVALAKNGVYITGNPDQIKILIKVKKLDGVPVTVQQKEKANYYKGVIYGVDGSIKDDELSEYFEDKYNIVAHRVKRFDVGKKCKVNTGTVFLSSKDHKLEDQKVKMGYKIFTIHAFVPRPTRCFKCQQFGHVATSCGNAQKCVRCGDEHKADECPDPNNLKCSNCGGEHSSAYTRCPVFVKKAEILKVKAQQDLTYGQAAIMVKVGEEREKFRKEVAGAAVPTAKHAALFVRLITLCHDSRYCKQDRQNRIRIVCELMDKLFDTTLDPEEALVDYENFTI
jgi:hypothetical protein